MAAVDTVRRILSANSSVASLTTNFTETTPLDATHGIVAHAKSYVNSATIDPTPTNLSTLASSGWTLLPNAGVTSSGNFKIWSGVFAHRGDGTINGITISTGTDVTAKQIAMAAVPNVKADTFWDTADVSVSAANVSSLALGPVTSTEADAVVLAFIALTGSSGSATGFAFTGLTTRGGTSSTSTSGYAEGDQATPGSVSTTASWTTASIARGFLLTLKTATPVPGGGGGAPVTYPRMYAWRSGAKWPARLRGVIKGGVERPAAYFYVGEYGGGGGGTGSRDPFLHPFVSTDPFNLGVSVDRVFEADSGSRNAHWIAKGNAAPSGGIAQVNDQATQFSVGVVQATTSDPVVTVTHPADGSAKAGTVYSTTVRIPTGFVPPTGSDHNAVVYQPGGTAHDYYRLVKVSNTAWTCTSFEAIDPRGSGIVRGIRAANISLLNGLIRMHEIQAVLAGTRDDFGHAIAISIPETALGPALPDPGFIWPANARDSTLITYSGPIQMGSFGAIPVTANAAASVSGLIPKALANTLTRYGAYIIDRSTTYAIYVEPTTSGVSINDASLAWLKNAAADMKNAWRDQLMVRFRFITNNTSTTPGGGAIGSARLAPDAAPLA